MVQQQQPRKVALTSANLEAAAAAAASLLKAKAGAAAVATPAVPADALHSAGAGHDQLQKRIADLELQLSRSEVRIYAVAGLLHSLLDGM